MVNREQEIMAEDEETTNRNWGGARPGAGRKSIAPVARNLNDCIRALDNAAFSLADVAAITGDPSYRMAAEMVTALGGYSRQRAFFERSPRAPASAPVDRD